MHPFSLASRFALTVVAYFAATCAAVIAILVWTMDLETIGGGFLVPLFVAPAIVAYASASLSRFRRWRRIVFFVAVLPMPMMLLYGVLFPSAAGRADGSDHWALAFLIPLAAATIVCYAMIELWDTGENDG